MVNIEKIRDQFPITKKKIYLNHAGTSPLCKPVAEAMQAYLAKRIMQEESEFELEDCRRLFAGLVNAQLDEIALIPNTSTGMNIAANMLQYPSGSNIVTTDLEFPSVVYPWLRSQMKSKVEIRYVRNVDGCLRQQDYEKAVDDKTVAVVVSHVEYSNGFRNNLRALAEITHEHGAVLIVDACQSAGALKIDVKSQGIDLLATSTYKWLLGPSGAGFLFVREELAAGAEPVFVGWASVNHELFKTVDLWENRELKLVDTAVRFETGTPSILSYVGAAAALKFIMEIGVENIEKRIMDLTGHLIERLRQEGFKLQTLEQPEHRSGIVNVKTENPAEKVENLQRKNIAVSARMNGIRVSPHFYNTEEELEKLIAELKSP